MQHSQRNILAKYVLQNLIKSVNLTPISEKLEEIKEQVKLHHKEKNNWTNPQCGRSYKALDLNSSKSQVMREKSGEAYLD